MANISCIPGLSLRCLNSKIESGLNYCDGKMTEAFSKTKEFIGDLAKFSKKGRKGSSNKGNGKGILNFRRLSKSSKTETEPRCREIITAIQKQYWVDDSSAPQDFFKQIGTEIDKTIKKHQSVLDLNTFSIEIQKYCRSFPSGSLELLQALSGAGIEEVRLSGSTISIAYELKLKEFTSKLRDTEKELKEAQKEIQQKDIEINQLKEKLKKKELRLS